MLNGCLQTYSVSDIITHFPVNAESFSMFLYYCIAVHILQYCCTVSAQLVLAFF